MTAPDIIRGAAHYNKLAAESWQRRAEAAEAAARKLLTVARQSEAFLSGFEGDELQEGLDHMLPRLRDAIRQAENML